MIEFPVTLATACMLGIAYAGLSLLCGFAAVWLAFKLFTFGAHHP